MFKALKNSGKLSRTYHYLRLTREFGRGGEPVLVYQMGRVGSTSIVRALRHVKVGPIFQVHHLSQDGILSARDRLRILTYGRSINVNRWCLYESRFILGRLNDIAKRFGRIRIISIVRDPICRNLSAFFYNLDEYIPNSRSRLRSGTLSMDEIRNTFLTNFLEHDVPGNWFGRELESFTGIKLDRLSFDPQRGFGVFRDQDFEILLLKLEAGRFTLESAITAYLKSPPIRLENLNSADDRMGFGLSKTFRQESNLPAKYVSAMYNNDTIKFFYTPAEIETMKSQWRNSDAS